VREVVIGLSPSGVTTVTTVRDAAIDLDSPDLCRLHTVVSGQIADRTS
jgi:hypothetical protein